MYYKLCTTFEITISLCTDAMQGPSTNVPPSLVYRCHLLLLSIIANSKDHYIKQNSKLCCNTDTTHAYHIRGVVESNETGNAVHEPKMLLPPPSHGS